MTQSPIIYADYAATTPCDEVVIEHMREIMRDHWGNPSSTHYDHGRRARALIDTARQSVAQLLGARNDELIFTSGATESCNLALKAIASSQPQRQIIVARTEHPAVTKTAETIAAAGVAVHWLDIEPSGQVSLDALRQALTKPTSAVALMLVNHQTGVIVSDPQGTASIIHGAQALWFSDLTQAIGRLSDCSCSELGIDVAACSSHKIYGPMGCGALYARRGLYLAPLIDGGGQEDGRRSGTENVPAIAGFGLAAKLQSSQQSQRHQRLAQLTQLAEEQLRASIPAVHIYGKQSPRAPGIIMCGAPHSASGWLRRLHGVAVSPGSSCASQNPEPSSVLTAMGVAADQSRNALRISLSHRQSEEEITTIMRLVAAAVNEV